VSFMKSLDLWCAYPDDLLAEEVAEACAAVVSEEELARCRRFRFDNNRREALTTRALSRIALSHYYPLPPQAWRFTANAQGKPAIDPVIDPDCKMKFNLSNSPELVVCLISDGAEVGVDVESFARAGRILELAPEVLSALERAGLDRLPEIASRPGADRPGRALSLWTLKEAYIKARGQGLALPLDKISFLFGGDEGVRLELDPELEDDSARWQFCLLDHAGHRIAAMTERRAADELEMWEVRGVLGPPARVTSRLFQRG